MAKAHTSSLTKTLLKAIAILMVSTSFLPTIISPTHGSLSQPAYCIQAKTTAMIIICPPPPPPPPPPRQLLGNPDFTNPDILNQMSYPWQGNQVPPWSGNVFQMQPGGFYQCQNGQVLTDNVGPSCSGYVLNPPYQIKGDLWNWYQNPGYLWVATISQGCGFRNTSCTPSWGTSKRQELLDPAQYVTTTVSMTNPQGLSQTLLSWLVGWQIENFALDWYATLNNSVSFYAPDACGTWAWRSTNFLELEAYIYMASQSTNSLWGQFPVGSAPVVVAAGTVTYDLLGCHSSGPYWIYIRTHPTQVPGCFPNWCNQITYPMYHDIVSAEQAIGIYPTYGAMVNFQQGIESANSAMLFWVLSTYWWGSG